MEVSGYPWTVCLILSCAFTVNAWVDTVCMDTQLVEPIGMSCIATGNFVRFYEPMAWCPDYMQGSSP